MRCARPEDLRDHPSSSISGARSGARSDAPAARALRAAAPDSGARRSAPRGLRGQREREARTASGPLRRRDAAAVRLDNGLADREPEACSADVRLALAALELRKQLLRRSG